MNYVIFNYCQKLNLKIHPVQLKDNINLFIQVETSWDELMCQHPSTQTRQRMEEWEENQECQTGIAMCGTYLEAT